MKYRVALGSWALIAGWLSACNTLSSEPPVQTAEVIYITATHNPTMAASVPSQTPLPGFSAAPTPNGPTFSREILFATEPDPIHAARNFSHRTPQVFAMVRYSGMTNGLRVHREWLQNGELYVERDTDWDFEKYGASGLMSDTSIFDHANGLPPGHYELRLWIAGEPQFSEDDAPFRSFDLGTDTPSPSLSPDGKYNLVKEDGGVLSVRDGSGRRRELAKADVIAGFDWLPDSLHVVYSTFTETPSRRFDLWVVDVEGGAAERLSEPTESLSFPIVSPAGGRIAVVEGNGIAPVCDPKLRVAVIELDRVTFKRVRKVTLAEFSGLNPPAAGAEIMTVLSGDGPGVWKSPTVLETKIAWTCDDSSTDGETVTLDLIGLTAEKSASP